MNNKFKQDISEFQGKFQLAEEIGYKRAILRVKEFIEDGNKSSTELIKEIEIGLDMKDTYYSIKKDDYEFHESYKTL